jgi:hypothetical protein
MTKDNNTINYIIKHKNYIIIKIYNLKYRLKI